MENNTAPVGCVIMASGLASRFGSNKLLALWQGRPLLAAVLDTVGQVFPLRVVVTRSPDVARLCGQLSVPCLLHSLPLRSDTVRLGLEALLARCPAMAGCLFCAGDQPLLTPQSLRAMAQAFAKDPAAVCRLSWQGQGGNPVLFPARLFPALRALPPGKGGGVLLQTEKERVLLVPALSEHELFDVDRPEDLARLTRLG